MNIQLVSDIHAEFHPEGYGFLDRLDNREVDVLVIAGDVAPANNPSFIPLLSELCSAYQADNGNPTPDRREQRIIKLIKKLKDAGHSLREIGSELRKRGYKSKTGKTTWNPKTVAAILSRAA